jgi:hypothetical protein
MKVVGGRDWPSPRKSKTVNVQVSCVTDGGAGDKKKSRTPDAFFFFFSFFVVARRGGGVAFWIKRE